MRARLASWAVAFAGLAAPLAAAESWIELKTADFAVVSNAGEGTARSTATEFEQVRIAFAKILPGTHLAEARPTLVLAFRDEGTMRKWAPSYFVKGGINVVSGSVGGADWEYLLLRTDARPSNVEVTPNYNVYRAYVSLLLSDSFERRLPAWLEVGLSYVLGNTSVSDKEIQVGRPVPWQFRNFNSRTRFPLRTVLDARYGSPLLKMEDQREVFDAQSYVLVHYLLFADGGAHEAQLTQFLDIWLSGRSQDQALGEVFGTLKSLEDVLPSYATRSVLGFARLKTEAKIAAERPPSHALSAAEVASLRGSLQVAMGRTDEAQAAIREARNADERSPVSYDAEGLLADHDHDKARAKEAYDRAVELGSKSPHSYYRSAQLAWKPQPDAATLALQRERLERAIALNDAYAEAHSYLADVLVAQGEGQTALESAKRAITLRPSSYYPRLVLARALDKLGRADDARKAAEVALRAAQDEDQRSRVEQFLSHLKQNSAYAAQSTRLEAAQQSTACSAGDAAACAAIRPALDENCGRKDAKACGFLSWLYAGHGLPKDDARAADYLGKACDAGDRNACVKQAWSLAMGEGVTKDEPKAISSLDALCSGDVLAACTRLALVYVAKPAATDRARAKPLLARACEGGEQEACSLAKQLK
jgi:Flp pilus assembly protein TadD